MRTDFQRDPGMYSNAIERNSFSAVSTSFLTTLKLQHFNNFIFELNPLIILPFPPFFSEQKISQWKIVLEVYDISNISCVWQGLQIAD